MAIGLDIDVDHPALRLGCLVVVPGLEALVRCDDMDLGPARRDEAISLLGDGDILQAPELVRVGEIPFLAEQIGGNAALVECFVEQRRMASYLRPAEQPCFQLPRWRRRLLGIAMQREPRLLPLAGGERQQVQRPGLDVARTIEATDIGMQAG
ncbi:MAG: hypothetical protein ACREIB_12065, partial [Pseudomonadota bacterium]